MTFNYKMGYSGNEQDYQLIKTSISELKKVNNQKEVLRYLTNVLPNPTDIVSLDNAQNTVKSVKAQLANKNLLPYPYKNSTKTIAGITFTVNSDGTITANGTATSNAYFEITSISTFYIPEGNYILSGCPSGGSSTTYNLTAVNGSGASYTKFRQDIGNGITLSSSGEYWIITCRVMAGQTVENLVFRPQIELGTTATAYTPYFSDFSTVKVSTYGKNLIPYPYYETTKTQNGITFTDNGDGTITVNGTATSTTSYILRGITWDAELPLPAGTYTISGCVSGGSSTNYNIALGGRKNENDSRKIFAQDSGLGTTVKLDSGRYDFVIAVYAGTTLSNAVFKPQLELGTTATEYEPYQGQTYTPTATGEVAGIEVLTPTTNIINDKGLLFTKVIGDDFNYIS